MHATPTSGAILVGLVHEDEPFELGLPDLKHHLHLVDDAALGRRAVEIGEVKSVSC